MDKKKIILVFSVIAFLLFLYFIVFKINKDSESSNSASFPLKLGSNGNEVKQLQTYLNNQYSAGLEVDGIWGALTDAAVNKFLKRDNVSESFFLKAEMNKI